MKTLKRELILCVGITAFVFVCALAWGNPFLAIGSGCTAAHIHKQQTQSAVFKGTVLRSGEQFLLRDASGQVFRLDHPGHVQPFEGKSVAITGRLDAQNKMIHVERIEEANA